MITRKKENIIASLAIVIISAASMIYCEVSSDEIEKHGRYTVGVVTKFKMNFRNGYTIYYEYSVSGVKYNENLLVPQDHPGILRGRFFIKYNSKKPNHSLILIDKPTLYELEEAPPGGWEEMPN